MLLVYLRPLMLSGALALLLAGCAETATTSGGEAANKLDLAERTEKAGDYITALKLYEDLRASYPDDPVILTGLGRTLAGLEMHNRAEQAFIAALAIDPNSAEAHYGLGKTLYRQSRLPEAEASFRQALTLDPERTQTYGALGATLDRQRRHEEAQTVYQEGLKRDPTSFALLNNLGLSYSLSGQHERGIQILRELVNDPRANPRVRQNLALAYGLAGQYEAATAVGAIDLPPDEVARNIDFYRLAIESLN